MMSNITACLIKELRLRTGAGFMECKRALIEEKGDIELSIDNLRKSGQARAEKKTHNITNQGMIFAKIKNKIGAMLELNCQTDFVAKDNLFSLLGKEIILTALSQKIRNIDDIKNIFEMKKTELISKVGENIKINRFSFIEGDNIFSYIHGGRIGVLVSASNLNKEILKNIAMHIAASKPEYLSPNEISNSVFQREYEIQLELAKKQNKSSEILKKIVQGRMNKFINNISLTGQDFIMDTTKTVGSLLNEHNARIISFIRFEVGEKKFN
ncbi:translation elongation factor Ts [uncultured Buchnera sp.]|uniref:translation elongation factor Ts n=1 Tax=uncultured Buchnera sp. TaxID=574037 RepID=UPI0025CDD453|nr:translation elongation factor Ts [uncultured Buchnera sp.]